jgi:DNA-binding MarR family transcriptional regulator
MNSCTADEGFTVSNTPENHEVEAQSLIKQIMELFSIIGDRFDSEENDQWQWIAQHSKNPLIVDLLRESTLTTLRVLDAIGQLEPVNGITISEQYRIPKGTVSKITRRLIAQNLIGSESLPNNKKEILFRLTPLGRELFEVHRAFDEQMERGFVSFLQRYNADELHFLVRVLTDAAGTSFIDLGLRSGVHGDNIEN